MSGATPDVASGGGDTLPEMPGIALRFRRSPDGEAASATERGLLEAVRRAGTLARADLIRQSGLSSPGGKALIDGLVARGLLALGPALVRGRGQPSASVSLVASYAYAFGLSLAVDGYVLVLVDFTGRPIARHAVHRQPLRLEEVARDVARELVRLREAHGIPADGVFGLGISMTGPFYGEGMRVNPPMSMPDEWARVELDRHFAARLGLPVWIDNDAKCAALAEAKFGVGLRESSLAYLRFTDGFAAGLVVDGRLMRGAHGNAGEIGRLLAATSQVRPTLELLRQMLAEGGRAFGDIHEMLAAYDPRWPEVDAWLDACKPGLTLAVAALVAFVDPGAIVLGERLPPDLADRLIGRIEFERHPRRGLHAPNPRLVRSGLSEGATGLGAAFLPFSLHFFG